MKKTIVLKVGSSLYMDQDGNLDREQIMKIAVQLAKLKRDGHNIVFVSSGAIASCSVKGLSKNLSAAIGQPYLINEYISVFRFLGFFPAQLLLTDNELREGRTRVLRDTIVGTFGRAIIPILNGNDPVDDEETRALLKCADNDVLCSLVCTEVLEGKVDTVIFGFDQDGVKRSDGTMIREVNDANFTEAMGYAIGGSQYGHGENGMQTKIQILAELARWNIDARLVPGRSDDFIIRAANGDNDFGTRFVFGGRGVSKSVPVAHVYSSALP